MFSVRLVAILATVFVGHARGLDVPIPESPGFAPAWETVGFSHDLWDQLDAQFADAVRRFVNDPRQARFDTKSRIMHVSRLLEWYRDDLTDPRFLPDGRSVAEFLSRYVDEGALARSLASQEWRTVYIDYDWKLNLRR